MQKISKMVMGLDWVTATMPMEATVPESALFELAVSAAAREACKDERREVVGILGYRGWRQGAITYGERTDGQIVIASGPASNSVWGYCRDRRIHPSRLDLQCTVWYEEDHSGLGQEFAAAASVSRETSLIRANTKIGVYDGKGDGDTAYIGSKTSESLFRFYDKYREKRDGLYLNAWRFEWQQRNSLARNTWQVLRAADDYREAIAHIIEGYLKERGLASFFPVCWFGRFYSWGPWSAFDNGQEIEVAL